MSDHATRGEGRPVTAAIEKLVDIFVTGATVNLVRAGCPAQRGAFQKCHGGAHGTFTVRSPLPDADRIGVFAGERYPAWVRFSSDIRERDSDLGEECGVGIKLFGVPGRKLTEEDALTHDFVLQNTPEFFVDDLGQMLADMENDAAFREAHGRTDRILGRTMRREVGSALCLPYWSCVPYRFGPDRYVKYKLVPEAAAAGVPPRPARDYLRDDLRRRLLDGPVRFTFCVQFRKDPERMPLERATVTWSEEQSRPVPFATLELPAQDVDEPGQREYVENLAFSPWHALPEHEPVGSIQQARKAVYAASAAARRRANGIPDGEPRRPR
jgi:hypothetical protein